MTDFDLLGIDDGETEAQNAEWFASDLLPVKIGVMRLEISVSAAVVIEVTFDSGSNWMSLNGNVALVADSVYIFDIFVKLGDTVNIRIPTASGAVVDIGRVYQAD
ncbi:hypothetical protein LCGC14_1669550 [marine sediment metagenome]|uniref:Uncharacterized protein n=1 Tax=marine sediment metagenome TaxID=412755 RepID=A0A0F9K7N1_9ZZZZ